MNKTIAQIHSEALQMKTVALLELLAQSSGIIPADTDTIAQVQRINIASAGMNITPIDPYADWALGKRVQYGQVVQCNGRYWKAYTEHITQANWQPDEAPELWVCVDVDADSNITTWEADIPFELGDTVKYNGVTYQVTQAHKSENGLEPFNAPYLYAESDGVLEIGRRD